MQRRIIVTATGDSLITRRMPDYPGGIPRLADASLGAEILKQMATLSEALGTRIDIRDGVGYLSV